MSSGAIEWVRRLAEIIGRMAQGIVDLETDVDDVADAFAGVLGQTSPQQPANRDGRRITELLPVGLAFDDRGERVDHRVATEGAPPAEHLVEHATERPDVCTRVDRLPTRL